MYFARFYKMGFSLAIQFDPTLYPGFTADQIARHLISQANRGFGRNHAKRFYKCPLRCEGIFSTFTYRQIA